MIRYVNASVWAVSPSPEGTGLENGRVKEFGLRIEEASRPIGIGQFDCRRVFPLFGNWQGTGKTR